MLDTLSDSRSAFAHSLREHGFILARGDRRGHVAVDRQGEVYPISRWVGIKAKEVRARLGEIDDLPSVEETRTLFESQLTDDHRDHGLQEEAYHQKRLDELNHKRETLVIDHRKAREILRQKQKKRRIDENKERVARLPTGLNALWSGVTGQYQKIVKENVLHTHECNDRDRQERQALIGNQLRERRILQHEILQARHHYHLTQKILGREVGRVFQIDPAQPLILPVDQEEIGLKARIQRSPERILDVITDKEETFSRNDIIRELGKYIDESIQLGGAIDIVFRSKALVEIETEPTPVYSTREMQTLEASLMEQAQNMATKKGHGVPNRFCHSAIKAQNKLLNKQAGASLSDEQCTAIHHILNEEQLSIAVGLAGAGKSTLLAAANHAWEKQGRKVIGAALSGKAADGLESASGIQSRTLASWELCWKNGHHLLQKGDVLVIDEAGMVGIRQMARFVEEVRKQGAKLVLVGDPEQLQPIQAGTPLKDMVEKIGAVELTEIRRQKSKWQRQASLDLARHRTVEAIQAYADYRAVHTSNNQLEAIIALVEDYMSDLELHGEKHSRLALAHRRKDVHKINQSIRAARKSSGDLNDEILFKTNQGPRAFAVGDRILFTRNDKELAVRNGSIGTVIAVDEKNLSVRLDDKDMNRRSQTLQFSPKYYPFIDHGYATTIHKSQGVTVDRTFVLSSKSMDLNLTYVAMTRHKYDAKLYTDSSFSFHGTKRSSPKHRRYQGPQ